MLPGRAAKRRKAPEKENGDDSDRLDAPLPKRRAAPAATRARKLTRGRGRKAPAATRRRREDSAEHIDINDVSGDSGDEPGDEMDFDEVPKAPRTTRSGARARAAAPRKKAPVKTRRVRRPQPGEGPSFVLESEDKKVSARAT